MPYVLSAVAAHTNPASARTSIGRPRRPSASEPFLPRPSAHVLSCHLASFVRIRPAQPQLQPAARARLLRPEIFFFFYLCAARASAVCGFFTTPNAIIWRATAFRSRRARMRVGFPVRVAVSIGESYVRTWPRATYVSPHVEKGEQNVCADYMYTRIRSEVTVRAWAWVYVVTRKSRIYIQLCTLVCVCMYGSMGRETVWHALWFQEAGGRWIRPSLLVVLVTATWLGYVLLSYRTF